MQYRCHVSEQPGAKYFTFSVSSTSLDIVVISEIFSGARASPWISAYLLFIAMAVALPRLGYGLCINDD